MSSKDDFSLLSGVGPATEEKLNEAGYETFQSLATANAGDLAGRADIGESTAIDVIQSARDKADIGGFSSASEVMAHRETIGKVSTLVPELDDLLGGGVESQAVTEIYGGFGAGKSQFTHQLAVNVQLPREFGGLEGRAIFIDSEDSFRPERIQEMVRGLDDEIKQACMEKDGLDTEDELVAAMFDRIDVADAFTSDHQMLLAEQALDIANEHADSDYPVRLIVVDSITSHFRAEYVGRGKLAERQQKLNRHFHDIKKVSNLHNAAAVIANQIQSNPDSYFGDPNKPIGGNILGHNSTFRLYIRNSKATKRVIKLKDSPNLPDGEAVVRIEMEGMKPE